VSSLDFLLPLLVCRDDDAAAGEGQQERKRVGRTHRHIFLRAVAV
jgi:hypothetical protein